MDFVQMNWKYMKQKSKAMNETTIYQVLYYIYYLKNKGIEGAGIVHYMDNHIQRKVILNEYYENKIKQVIRDIAEIKGLKKPPQKVKRKACTKCSYYELCFC